MNVDSFGMSFPLLEISAVEISNIMGLNDALIVVQTSLNYFLTSIKLLQTSLDG